MILTDVAMGTFLIKIASSDYLKSLRSYPLTHQLMRLRYHPCGALSCRGIGSLAGKTQENYLGWQQFDATLAVSFFKKEQIWQ